MITCPECRKRISETATSCPKCGRILSAFDIAKAMDKDRARWKFLKWVLIVTIALPVLFSLFMPKNKGNDHAMNTDTPVIEDAMDMGARFLQENKDRREQLIAEDYGRLFDKAEIPSNADLDDHKKYIDKLRLATRIEKRLLPWIIEDLKMRMKEPLSLKINSLEELVWDINLSMMLSDGAYYERVKYSAKNTHGEMVENIRLYSADTTGMIISTR